IECGQVLGRLRRDRRDAGVVVGVGVVRDLEVVVRGVVPAIAIAWEVRIADARRAGCEMGSGREAGTRQYGEAEERDDSDEDELANHETSDPGRERTRRMSWPRQPCVSGRPRPAEVRSCTIRVGLWRRGPGRP